MTNSKKFEFESALSSIRHGLKRYSDAHAARYGSPLAEDYVLGEAWIDSLRGLRALLNGETGHIDCGKFDASLCELAKSAGFTDEEL